MELFENSGEAADISNITFDHMFVSNQIELYCVNQFYDRSW